MNNTDSIVMKIGGSLLYKDNLALDNVFLSKFVNWFDKAKSKYSRIVIIVGGGKMSRYLVEQTGSFEVSEVNQHRIGMAVTVTNAEILRAVVNSQDVEVPKTLGQVLEFALDNNPKKVIIGGFKEGWSTDMDASVMAHVMGVQKVYKLSNIDYIYTADPAMNPDARPLTDLTWDEYFTQFGIIPGVTTHKPGQSLPIGAFCSQFAAKKGLTFVVSGGKKLEQESDLFNVLESGSVVHP